MGSWLFDGLLRANPCVSAPTLDNHLQKHGSPLAGLGQVFIEAGASYRVDPRLLVAIAGQETGYATKQLVAPMNPFNWFYAGSNQPRSASNFENFENAITETTRGIRDHFWDTLHKTTIQLMPQGADGYTGTQKDEWASNVTAIYQALGGDLNDLSYTCPDTHIVFFDDAETARGNNWGRIQGTWEKTTSPFNEPWFSLNHAWRSGIPTNANYSLTSNEVDLGSLSSASLTFWHKYAIRGHGGVWVWIKPTDGDYVSVASYSGSGPSSWSRINVNLNRFLGHRIQVFFQLYTTSPVSGDGWHIDNVLISGSQSGSSGMGSGQVDYDAQAKRDMTARAAQDGRFGLPIPETFGSDLEWLTDWELRWMAFNVTGNRYGFVYDARNRHSGDRFTTYFDPDTNKLMDWVHMP